MDKRNAKINNKNQMPLKDKLQIILITYNRAKYLSSTLESLLNSPVNDFSITILDNTSQDNTFDVCNKYKQKFTNFKYIRNNRNLGAVGNILKAMELADKKWLWILGDDDTYNWKAWPEIENALNQDYDIVNTCWHDGARSNDPCVLLNELGFVPTGIYQTKNITPVVMQNAHYISLTLNPHSAIAAEVVNNGGKIYVPNQKLVIENMKKDYSAIVLKNDRLHKEMSEYNVIYATLKIYELIKDKAVRYKCNEVLVLGSDFRHSMDSMLYMGLDLRKVIDTFFMLSLKQKTIFLITIIKHYAKRFIKRIFHIKNKGNYRTCCILGLTVKFRKKNK